MGVSDGITSLKLGDPWWGALTKKKNVMALHHFESHLGITSLVLGDPRWGALT